MEIILHVCCGTCVIGLLEFFKNDKLSLFFYNPNIEPEEEYQQRLNAVRQVAQEFGLDLIEYQYENKLWHEKVKGLEKEPENGKRCLACFEMRLEKTAEMAKKLDFEAFATSLSVNCWKDVDFINKKGKEMAEKNNLKFFDFNLSKEEIKKICYAEKELAKKHKIYRQKYCGCLYAVQNQM